MTITDISPMVPSELGPALAGLLQRLLAEVTLARILERRRTA